MDYYMNSIDDKQNGKDFFYQSKKFEYNHDFVKFSWKSDYALEIKSIWDYNVGLYETDY